MYFAVKRIIRFYTCLGRVKMNIGMELSQEDQGRGSE